MERKQKWDLAALATIPLAMTLANSMLIPILPLMQKKLNITSLQTSLIITVYAAISIVCIPLAGYLSDRFGRKIIIVIGLIIAAAGGFISALGAFFMGGHTYGIILTGRLIQGIGAAGAFPIVLPLVGDMFNDEEKVSSGLGMIETSNTFGKVASPIAGSALALVVWYLPLAAIPAICALSVIAVAFFVKAPKTKKPSRAAFNHFLDSTKNIFSSKGRWLYGIFAIGGNVMFIMFGFLFYLSSVLEEHYDMEGIRKGLLLAIPLCAICLASYIAGKMVGENRSRMRWFTFAGVSIIAVAMLTCGLINSKSLIILIALMFMAGAGIGISLPSLDALITEGIDKKQRGTITSLYSSARFVGVAGGPLAASLLLNNDRWLFYAYAAIALACCMIALVCIKPKKTVSVKP